jgi:hypothetical protein
MIKRSIAPKDILIHTVRATWFRFIRTQRGGILNRAGRCNWTFTFILALTGRGDRERALPGREREAEEAELAIMILCD